METYLGDEAPTRNEVFQQLLHAKNYVSNMSLDQQLHKDLKVAEIAEIGKIAVASVSGSLTSSLKLNEKLDSLRKLCSSNSYAALVVLGIDNKNAEKIERDIAIYSNVNNLTAQVS